MLRTPDGTVSALAEDPIRAGRETVEGGSIRASSSTPFLFRLSSLDAYRGFVMLLMMAEVLRLCGVAAARPESAFWKFLCHHQSHVEWVGCSLHDLIQPSFSFLVGVALPFSLASRRKRGQSEARMAVHAFARALALVCLGIFLRSVNRPMTYFTFEDTLTQIGLGYGFLFLLGLRPMRDQWIALGLILSGYWLAFALYPLPNPGFDPTTVGVQQEWPHLLTGFAAHWNKNMNFASAFDQWFLNLFPREKAFVYNGGGYLTLSFIPTLGTMILGLIAGQVVRREGAPWGKVRWLAAAGLIGLASGWLLGWLGVCPVVKRIWTPSWVLFSGGWCCLLLAAFYTVLDMKGYQRWAFPLIIIGMNSIAAYCLAELSVGFISGALKRHMGENSFLAFGAPYEPLVLGACVLTVLWLILFWMYRKRIFLRI
jgi:heparan-alpha-glucosaminide N-acetyltransferase